MTTLSIIEGLDVKENISLGRMLIATPIAPLQSNRVQRRQRYFSGSVHIALRVATAVSGTKTN
ncbi:MAG: hypothetical protein GY805_22915 [Chloroflexi bacterium]|nr:hypothetical protein [Chloroflexota bacterium]